MIKSGVILPKESAMAIVHIEVIAIFAKYGYGCVLTSGMDSKHGDRSLHPVGLANDYRSKHIPELSMKYQILSDLKQALPCCDVVLEYIDQPQEHYHIEYDPKYDDKFQQDKEEYKLTGVWPE